MGKHQDLQQQQQQQLHLQQQQQQQNQQLQHQQQQSQAQLQPTLVYSPQVPIQCGSMYPSQIMFAQHNGNLMPFTTIQQTGGNLIHMTHPYNNKQNKNVAIAASPQQPMLLTTSQIPTIIPNNQQPPILPNPGKSNEPREKLAARSISSSVSPKVISHGTQQIQPKSNLSQQMINNQSGLITQQYKLMPQNSLFANHSPQTLNNSYYIQASPGPTGAILSPNNQSYLPRTSNQSDQMVLVTPSTFNTAGIFINQSSFVSNNATSVISVSSSNSHSTTNTTQSGTNKGQTCAIAPSTQHTSTNRYKNLKPAIVQSSIGTQTLTPVITLNHPPNANSAPTTMNIAKGKSHKNVQNSSNKVPIDKQESDGRQTMTVTLIPQINNPSAAQLTNEKTITPDNSRNITIGSSDSKGTNKIDSSDQTGKAINDESKFSQSIQNRSQDKLKNKTLNTRNVSNSALKEKVLQSSNKEMVEKKDAAIGNDVGLMVSVAPESNVSQDMNNLSNSRKKPTNGIKSNGVKSPRKAIVKPYVNDPNVLTHVIDGFVIQESQSPFPIDIEGLQETNSEGTTMNGNIEDRNSEKEMIVQNDQMFDKNETSNTPLKSKIDSVCECCCKIITKGSKKKKLKRFCSNICARKFNTNAHSSSSDNCTADDFKTSDKTLNKFTAEPTKEMNIDDANNQSHEPNTKKAKIDNFDGPPESMDINEGDFIPASGTNPNLWSVQDVYDFVRNLPGCQEYADEFKSQEIDGQALMLLKEDHLMTAMNMKLGPALKICSRINSIFRAETAKS